MQLPFIKRKSSSTDIDIKIKTVASAVAAPPSVIHRVQPDLGDYQIEHPDQLPAWGRAIPFIFWAAVIGFGGWMLYSKKSNAAFTNAARSIQEQLIRSEERLNIERAESVRLEGKIKDLNVLSKFIGVTEFTRDIVSAAFQSANDRVLVRSLDIKRRDFVTSRYSIVMICTGTRQSFDAMRADITGRLKELGWSVSESLDEQDERLIFSANISRTTSG